VPIASMPCQLPFSWLWQLERIVTRIDLSVGRAYNPRKRICGYSSDYLPTFTGNTTATLMGRRSLSWYYTILPIVHIDHGAWLPLESQSG